MKKRISDLLDGYGDGRVELSGDTPLSSARIKELTMSKIAPNQKKPARWPARLLTAAAIAAALTVSTFAVVHIAGAGELMQNFFTKDEDSAPLTSGQIEALDQVGKTFGEGVTDNGATITPIAAIADEHCFYLRLRIEAPEGTVLPDLDPDTDGYYQLWGQNWPEEKLTFTSETGEMFGGYGGGIEVLPDDDPTDNVKEVVVRYEGLGSIGTGEGAAVFNDGSFRLLTIHGLWIQSPYKVYTPVFTGEFALEVGGCFEKRLLTVECGGADYHDPTGYGYTMWMDQVELSPLSITVNYRDNVNEAGSEFIGAGIEGLQVVMKDGTVALDYVPWWKYGNEDGDYPMPDEWDPAAMLSGGPMRTRKAYDLFDQPLDLDQVDYIKFGEHIIPVNPQ